MLCRLSSVVYLVKLWSPDERCGGVLSCCRFLGFRSVMDQSFLHSRSTLSPAVRGSRGWGEVIRGSSVQIWCPWCLGFLSLHGWSVSEPLLMSLSVE
uniref:Uncharacterized protein n=1 Tax=Brassica oleracea TaxID=3712 RepID=A0A3P6DNL9_BRAOL|nr:unnamed protein product [Brassica oleracea]